MPRKATSSQRARFFAALAEGLSQAKAAKVAGISESTARRWRHGMSRPAADSLKAKLALQHNPPKAFDDLSDLGKRCLEDFEFFATTFFCLRVPAWWRIAAQALVDDVASPEETFRLLHAPSGAGKTTLLETLVAWLVSGGGTCDPESGRALRVMFASSTLDKAVVSVDRLRRIVEDSRPFFDFRQKLQAAHSLLEVYGRYRPAPGEGDDTSIWRKERFTVAQVGERGLFQKDPTLSAYSLGIRGPAGSSPLSVRADVAVIDDAALSTTVGDEDLHERFQSEFESRVEPGGSLFAVGQRLHAQDLYGALAARTWEEDQGELHPVYSVLSFPAHRDHAGDDHREWDGATGCLLDAVRLPYATLQRKASNPGYAPFYQQDVESSTAGGLVDPAWVYGGPDSTGWVAEGSLDRERAMWEPVAAEDGRQLVTYLSVDPAEGGMASNASWWALEVWTIDPQNKVRYLIYGTRGQWDIQQILDFRDGEFTGVLQDIVFKAATVGCRVSSVVIEQNAAHTFLQQRDFQEWRAKWHDITVIPFMTGKNKRDPVIGLHALLPSAYRQGLVRLPYRSDVQGLNYLKAKIGELTKVRPKTGDTVMSEWVGAASLERVIAAGTQPSAQPIVPGVTRMPGYLVQQQRSIPVHRDNGDPVFSTFKWNRGGSHVCTKRCDHSADVANTNPRQSHPRFGSFWFERSR